MSPASSDPQRRARQLANLRKGGTVAPAGNRRAVRHGAYAVVAAARLDVKAREVYEALAHDAPLRDAVDELPAADGAAVRLAAEVMCRLDDLSAWLAAHGWLDANDQPRESLLDLERRLRGEAADHLDSLGMTPRARARLGLDVARAAGFDLAAQWAEDDAIDGTAANA